MSNVVISANGGSTYHQEFCPHARRITQSNRTLVDEYFARTNNYKPCAFCCSPKGLAYKYRNMNGGESFYDPVDDAICIKTKVGFWKIIKDKRTNLWKLYHMNHNGYKSFDSNRSPEELMRGNFHRQDDVSKTSDIDDLVTYIRKHDHSRAIYEDDYRRMPKSTKQERKYYRQAKKRKRRESIKNVYALLDKIKMEENAKQMRTN